MSELPCGVATGIGSLPGTDIVEAIRLVFGELPDFPHVPELPQRGPGADMLGRGAALLVDLPVELRAGRWRSTRRPGADLRRSRDYLERDLDALTDQAIDHDGHVKIAATGPWTLAAGIERPIGGALLGDTGAVADLSASLAEGLASHVAQVKERLPYAKLVLQLDEPGLPSVLAGEVPTESGFSRYRAIEDDVARARLAAIVDAVGIPVIVHCCAPEVPVELLTESGAAGVSLDLSLINMDDPASLDPLGVALESGFGLLAGVVPALPPASARLDDETREAHRFVDEATSGGRTAAESILRLWHRLGLPRHDLPERVSVTPACGMAGACPEYVRAALSACRQAAKRLHD